jgi:hypothetical protein
MRVIKVIYDKRTEFICEIVQKYQEGNIIELLDCGFYKNLKRIRPIQTRFGSKNLPLIVFEDENLNEVFAIWPEANPDWDKAIEDYLKNV